MLSRPRLPARFPIGTKYVLEGSGRFVRRYIEFPNGRRVQLATRNAQSVVLHVRGIATDRYCPGPECRGDRCSVVAPACTCPRRQGDRIEILFVAVRRSLMALSEQSDFTEFCRLLGAQRTN